MLLVSLPNFITSFWVIADIIFLKINLFPEQLLIIFDLNGRKLSEKPSPPYLSFILA